MYVQIYLKPKLKVRMYLLLLALKYSLNTDLVTVSTYSERKWVLRKCHEKVFCMIQIWFYTIKRASVDHHHDQRILFLWVSGTTGKTTGWKSSFSSLKFSSSLDHSGKICSFKFSIYFLRGQGGSFKNTLAYLRPIHTISPQEIS